MKKATNPFEGCKVGNNRVKISHLQFTDDTLIIGNMPATNISTIKGILRWFELISGHKVNFYKSKLAANPRNYRNTLVS